MGRAGDGRRRQDHSLHRPEEVAQVGLLGEGRRARDAHGGGAAAVQGHRGAEAEGQGGLQGDRGQQGRGVAALGPLRHAHRLVQEM